MKILLTGANSFTGYWFSHTLADAGHDLTMTLRRDPASYDGVRRERALALSGCGRIIWPCTFGDEMFMAAVADGASWDLFCHHAAHVADYRSPDFNVSAAFTANTRNIDRVFATLADCGCTATAVTGSLFEPGEGAGSGGLPAFSAYGLSKALTSQSVVFYASRHNLACGKFVIPNPFGPFEEPRFTSYLVRCWLEGKTATVRTPAYVRDNIHVSLLARAYAEFIDDLATSNQPMQLNPSGYTESQGSFAARFSHEMQKRLGTPCPLELLEQSSFDEPRVRINTDAVDASKFGWDATHAWDAIADFYLRRHQA